MTERGILFSGRLVRRINANAKTQTRRIAKFPPEATGWAIDLDRNDKWWPMNRGKYVGDGIASPYGLAGDRLYVREAWRTVESLDELRPSMLAERVPIRYEADEATRGKFREPVGRYRHGRFMPRWASRIDLDVVSVRIERLQNITAEDAIAEGVELGVPLDVIVNGERSKVAYFDARVAFAHLWCGVNGADAWKANPWVWVVEFRRAAAQERAA